MQTILGAGGAIGIRLAKSLKYYSDDIRLVSRNPKKVNDADKLVSADLTKREQVFNAVKGSDIVYLTVGLDYRTRLWQQVWPPIMRNVLDACEEYHSKFVFFDNIYMIGGDNVKHITESSTFSPTSKKGKIRETLDKMLLERVEKGKLNAIIARAADFYGPDGSKSILMELVYKNLLKGKNAQWLFNAKTRHSFTYTPDAGKGTAILGNTPSAYNQIWNLPTDQHSLTGEEWIHLFAGEMGKPDKYSVISAMAVKLAGLFVPFISELYEMRYQYDRDYFFDSSKFEKYFKFTPTSYQKGVKEIVNHLSIDDNPLYIQPTTRNGAAVLQVENLGHKA